MKKMLSMALALLMALTSLNALAEEPGVLDYTPLKELSVDNGFTLGAALGYEQMSDVMYLMTVKRHFDTITPTNELKAYSLLDQRASQASTDGMPRMNFQKADKMVEWAMKNGLQVRGHVLVWDAYMNRWFFHVDYDTSKPVADREAHGELHRGRDVPL